jgi:aspartate kinase
MRVLIQKYGGTSVATQELRLLVAEKIIHATRQGYSAVAVISAIGRKGAPYATDTLLQLALETNGNISHREIDLLLNCGEIISGVLMTGAICGLGTPAVFLTGAQAGIITNDQFGDARIIRIEPKNILGYLKEGKVVVVAGFQGITENGELTTLGRGGSDTTAAALGVALDAEAIEIYTDVDGIKTADPRIVSEAKTLSAVSYTEACQFAHEGAKVIHPRAVEIAMQKNIPIKVKCTFNDSPGTLVTTLGEMGTISLSDRIITGITHNPNLTQITIDIEEGLPRDIQLKTFKSLALAGISVDFINVSQYTVMFTVKNEETAKAKDVLENMGIQARILLNCAKIAAVGAGMTGRPGVMAQIVEAFTKEGIKILQSADSYTSIWCLVENKDMERAVRSLHESFQLGN